MKYGELKYRLTKQYPGIDPELLEGWIADRYSEILDQLNWERLRVEATLTLVEDQSIYTMPADCRQVEMLVGDSGELEKMSRERLRATSTAGTTGTPRVWAPAVDSTGNLLQIEVYPVPDAAGSIPYSYFSEKTAPTSTSITLLPLLRPAALVEGVSANVLRHMKDWNGALVFEKRFADLVATMIRGECRAKGGQQLRMASRFTRHRLARVIGGNPFRGA